MVPPNWNAFAGVTLVVLVVLIALARASQAMFVGDEKQDELRREEGPSDGVETPSNDPIKNGGHERAEPVSDETISSATSAVPDERIRPVEPATPAEEFTPGTLLVNVALSQGLFGVILVVAAFLTAIPADVLGVGSVTTTQFGVGALLGVVLYVANELGQRVADGVGIEYEDGLREMLTPDSLRGWAVLLALVLPIIAGFEELLFRSSLVGVFAAGFGISPWFLVVASSVAFAVGHGAQGPAGVLVTGTLGVVLASAFVLTGSVVVVVVAHYLVNTLEFVVHAHDDSSR